MNQAAFPDRLREFFTLRETERSANALSVERRTAAAHELSLAFQKREAAETLWPRGSSAEALKLAKASLDLATEALDAFATGDETVTPPEAPRPAEAAPPWLASARATADAARKRVEGASLPELESDARASDEELFHVMIAAGMSIERTMGLGLAAPGEIAATRRSRRVTAVGVVGLVALALAWWSNTPLILHATASTQAGPTLGPENAIDDNPKTPWVVPDKQTGWLDITVGKPRTVGTLRILPSNPPYNDRSVKDAHIEAFLGDKAVKATDVTFREPSGAEPEWTEVPLGAKCDRIRITVRSNYRLSASISEVQIK